MYETVACVVGVQHWRRPENLWLPVTWLCDTRGRRLVWKRRDCGPAYTRVGYRFELSSAVWPVLVHLKFLWLCSTSHESLHSLDPKVVRCVSVHPRQQQYVAVAENRCGWSMCRMCWFWAWIGVMKFLLLREVSIYDARCLKKTRSQPVSQLQGHSLSISSCYFSPCTGNRVVTSCMDNYIRCALISTFTHLAVRAVEDAAHVYPLFTYL